MQIAQRAAGSGAGAAQQRSTKPGGDSSSTVYLVDNKGYVRGQVHAERPRTLVSSLPAVKLLLISRFNAVFARASPDPESDAPRRQRCFCCMSANDNRTVLTLAKAPSPRIC